MERTLNIKELHPDQASKTPTGQLAVPIVVVDGVISDKTFQDVVKELGYEEGTC
ncbi:MAG: hypothetical protein MZU84_07780 [Sphingobacterium sp.]|nr:hypothetical protein [Sphingobacterium sp.]